jgi:hypothetical protein
MDRCVRSYQFSISIIFSSSKQDHLRTRERETRAMLLTFLTVISLVTCIGALCPYGCPCRDDSTCQYYCSQRVCQQVIPYQGKCSGFNIHPQECGFSSFCDPKSDFTCQLKKIYGEDCFYSYSCLSNYCDYRTNTCQSKDMSNFAWMTSYLLPSVVFFGVLMVIIALLVRHRQRQRARAYFTNPYVILPPNRPYSYQNSFPALTEVSPPAYSQVTSTAYPKPYQG